MSEKLIDYQDNLSVSGKNAQGLGKFQKLGTALFTLGAFLLIGATFLRIIVIPAFTLMLIGAGLFLHYPGKQYGLRQLALKNSNNIQRFGMVMSLVGLAITIVAWLGVELPNPTLFLWLTGTLTATGILVYTYGSYAKQSKGIKNNYVWNNSLTGRGLLGWIAGIGLTLFYIQLYWFSSSLKPLIGLFDPLSYLLKGKAADQWFVYGTIYTFVILFLGIKFMVKYRHNRYQLIRTIVVILSQLVLAYFIPNILESMNEGVGYFSKDLKNVWPLNYYFTESWSLDNMTQPQKAGPSGFFFFVWGILLFLIVTPVLTYLVGKRWYCSWVCGCGGLAETAGDGFRHLSSKKLKAWKIERWMIHVIMVFVLVMTVATLWPYFSGKDYVIGGLTITKSAYVYFAAGLSIISAIGLFVLYKKFASNYLLWGAIILGIIAMALSFALIFDLKQVFVIDSRFIKKMYGFLVGSAFSGVIGVGFYPILGNRVWCRFGCPMAGYMGIIQRFKSRFRITTNGAQCISCGNCSTYCEQGIDVRSYAQKGQNIVRASCVGCGVCAAVCPRGVLKLENGPEEGRFEPNPIIVDEKGIRLGE